MGTFLRFWLLALAVGLDGRPVTQLAPPGSRAVVLFFAASDCPISNRYVPEIQRLAQEYSSAGVRVWFVYPNAQDDAQVVQAHNREFGITAQTALDKAQTLTKMAGAATTPEAAVFLPQGDTLHEVYRGRIDDRYINLGTERPQPTHHDLEEAIRAVLAGKPVPKPSGPAVGCSIVKLAP
jgi:thiol-disulfide isomerase/thioredoxin